MPLAEQRRELWDAEMIAEGVTLVERTLGTGLAGPYQLQAAIAAVHGPRAGLAVLGTIEGDGRIRLSHRLEAVRANDRAPARAGSWKR